MILQKLCEYYDRIDADPTQTIAQEGFAPQKVSFAVVINEDGTLHDIQDVRDTSGKKAVPQTMLLPYNGKRASGVKAMFLWDKAEYLLGYVSPELDEPENETPTNRKKREKKIQRIAQCHLATQELHESFRAACTNEHFQLLCRFLENWRPESLAEQQTALLNEVGTGFGVFRIQGQKTYLHEIEELRNAWAKSSTSSNEDDVSGLCLISGEQETLARLHPVIKGVRDAQTSGASIVSFNDDAFTSYGKKQSFNAPVSENAHSNIRRL